MSRWLRWHDRKRLAAFSHETEAIARAVGPPGGERLLDVGGGTGVMSERFGGGFREVVVLEPNEKKRRFGQSVRPHVRFVGGTAERIALPDAQVDCVTATFSFHHFRDRKAALSEIHRVLRDGGRLVVFEFSKSHGAGRLLRWLPLHHGLIDALELAREAEAAGFVKSNSVDLGSGYLFTAVK